MQNGDVKADFQVEIMLKKKRMFPHKEFLVPNWELIVFNFGRGYQGRIAQKAYCFVRTSY